MNKIEDNALDSTSGYTQDIDSEMTEAAPIPVQNGFDNIREVYVSASGHTRLFSATRYGKRYMLKCLKPDFLYTPVYRQALTKEFEIGLQLDHPYICRTIGMEEVEGIGAAIILEYIDGDTLKELIDTKTLTADLGRRVMEQLADALEYIHSKQIIHRDLKASNIMVTHNGHNVKLIDFSLSDSGYFNVLKCPAGTSGYIAPEQLLPDAKADVQADVYSFGVVLLDMARQTGDSAMMRIGKACTRIKTSERPLSIREAVELPHTNPMQRLAVIVLACVAAVLAVLVVLGILHNSYEGSENATDSTSVSSDNNRAMDYYEWPGTGH